MSKLWFLLATGLLMAAAVAGCSKVAANQNYADPGKTIDAGVGDIFTISLAANPTTGYDWAFSGGGGVIQLLDKSYQADNTGVTGSGGTDCFRFKVQAKGNATLVFDYERPWETTSVDQKIFSLVAD
jgi:inhibitor of cysteine peptidase